MKRGGIILLVLTFLNSLRGSTQPASGTSKPNVLFIVADDMNGYSVLDNYPVLKTPFIDKLVSQSYFFRNAVCNAPVCIPSRCSFFSGKYPHNTGIYMNVKSAWEKSIISSTEALPECFKRNGYTTWGGGKVFHTEINNDRETKMFDNKVFHGGFGPFTTKENWYGKNHWASIKPWEGPDDDFPDVVNAKAAASFLQQKHDKPFFMYYGMYRPHTPYTAPKRFFDLYKDEEMTLPPGYVENDLDDVPEMGKALVDSMKRYKKEGLTKKQVWLKLMKAYCANTSFADYNLGQVLNALDKSAYAKNTIVIFVSDNGFHNGAKNHYVKSTLWEQADMVPFLVRLPDGKSYKCPQTISLVDIYPTLVEYCGLVPPRHKLDGQSFVSVLKNPGAKWDKPGFTFYGERYSSVRTERYRYIQYPDGSEELYDHSTDPYEIKNIAKAAGRQEEVRKMKAFIPQTFVKSVGGRHEKAD